MARQTTQPPAPGGVISADEAYLLDQVQERLRMGTAAIRTARRNGLKVRRVGRNSVVLGKDLLSFIESCEIVA